MSRQRKGGLKTANGFLGFSSEFATEQKLDPEIERLFNQLSKKEPVTKIKALGQEKNKIFFFFFL